jgi:Cellulose biosynthesis protein BcsN
MLSIVERVYWNATRQTALLSTRGRTSGENFLRVDVIGVTNSEVGRESTLPEDPLNEGELFAEAEEALPDVPLRATQTYVQNRYGPFGYAVGASTQGDECIYAWQRLATPDENLSIFNTRNTLSLRLRLCEPRVTEAQLVAVMMGLSINVAISGGSWSREPKPLTSDAGVAGVVIAPPEVLSAAKLGAAQAAPRPRIIKSHVPELSPASVAPPPGGVVVPPPPLGSPIAQPSPGPVVPAPSIPGVPQEPTK